jgi:hypothetical protein
MQMRGRLRSVVRLALAVVCLAAKWLEGDILTHPNT